MVFQTLLKKIGLIKNTKIYKRNFRKFHRFRKKVKVNKCNILRFYEGTYASDSGESDYKRFHVVKHGKVYKKVLRRYKKGEDTYFFNLVELRPITPTAYVKVIIKGLGPNSSISVYNVVLFRTFRGVRRILNDNHQ